MSFRLVGTAIAALGAVLMVSPTMAAAKQCPSHVDVRNLMTVSQYDRAGLNKLDKNQLAALNRWLTHYAQGLCARANKSPRTQPGSAAAGSTRGRSTTPSHPRTKGGTGAATPPPTRSQNADFGAPPKPKAAKPGRIESRVVGDFRGWTGNTIFRLENGQIWKQAGPGYFQVNMENPKVTIKKLLIGYVLKVHGYAKEVFVRRVK